MAFVYKSNDAINTSATTSVTTTFPSPTTAGNLLVASVFSSGVALGSNTISGWTLGTSVSFLSSVDETTILLQVATGSETGITATCTGATGMVLAIHEFNTNPLLFQSAGFFQIVDQADNNTTATPGTTLSTNAVGPTKPKELVFAAMGFPTGGTSAWSWGQGLTLLSTNAKLMDGFIVKDDIATITPTASWTGASTAGGVVVSLFATNSSDTMYRHVVVGDGASRSEVAN